MRGLRSAVAFLTVLPTGHAVMGGASVTGSMAWYAPVGLLLGGLLAGVAAGAWEVLPAFPAAVMVVAAWAALTGALHLDGLADCADAACAPVPRARRLEILRDVHHGTFAAVAVALLLLLKASLLTVPTAEGAAALVLCAPVAGRALIPGCARVFRPARPDGLAATAARPPVAAIVTAALVAAAAGLLAFGAEGVAIVAIGAGAGVAACAWLARRFGGVTGDVYGAVIELTEAATLLAGSAALANGWACPFPLVHR